MSARELGRVEVLARVKAGSLALVEAATVMGVSYRQAKRLWRAFKHGGAKALRHGQAGRPSNRRTAAHLRQRVGRLIRQKYSGDVATRFGPTLVAEPLASEDGLTIDHETLRRWMLAAGLWSRQRTRPPYRRRRERKAHFGELVQLDGSFHQWYEARGDERCLITMVDDATSRSSGRFSDEETIWAAAAVLRRWIEQYGVPLALYTDWKNVYVRAGTAAEQAAGVVPRTQFGRMCADLQIQIIPASFAASQRARGAESRHAPGPPGQETAPAGDRGGRGGECVPRDDLLAAAQRALCPGPGRGGRLPSALSRGDAVGPGVSPRSDANDWPRLGRALSQSRAAAGAAKWLRASAQHRHRV